MTQDGQGVRNRKIGSMGEDLAAAYLMGMGYTILERNYRARGGEIDIVARQGGTTVFVEVKTRRSCAFGEPQWAVTHFKQRQIARAALTWLAKNRCQGSPARFDVLAVLAPPGQPPTIDHISNAFDLPF